MAGVTKEEQEDRGGEQEDVAAMGPRLPTTGTVASMLPPTARTP